jgi:hypothetical protein
MPNNRNLRDTLLKVSGALPASTTATATTGLSLLTGVNGDFVAPVDFLVTAPALTTSQLPDNKTMTYTVETSAPSDAVFGSPSTVYTLGTQTGASGAGSAGATYKFRLPSSAQGNVRVKATPAASGTGDASGAKVTLEVLS